MAIADFDAAIRLEPRASATYDKRAMARLAMGDYRGAGLDYTQVISMIPRDTAASTYNTRGAVRHTYGDFDRAIEDYNQAIEINPELCVAYISRGNARYHMRDLNAAEDFQIAYQLDPMFTVRETVRCVILDLERGSETVLRNCWLHIRFNCDDHVAYSHRTVVLTFLGREAEAQEDFQTAHRAEAKQPRLARRARGRDQA